MHTFVYEDHELKYQRIDIDLVQEGVGQWEEANPLPTPPSVPLTPQYFKAKDAMRAAAIADSRNISQSAAEKEYAKGKMRLDEEDEEFLAKLERWKIARYVVSESIMLSRSILWNVDGEWVTMHDRGESVISVDEKTKRAFVAIMADNTDDGARIRLYKAIRDESTLTWDAVYQASLKLGVTRRGYPILDKTPSGSSESQPLMAIALQCMQGLGKTPSETRDTPMGDLAMIVAIHLCAKWQEYFAHEDARANRK